MWGCGLSPPLLIWVLCSELLQSQDLLAALLSRFGGPVSLFNHIFPQKVIKISMDLVF